LAHALHINAAAVVVYRQAKPITLASRGHCYQALSILARSHSRFGPGNPMANGVANHLHHGFEKSFGKAAFDRDISARTVHPHTLAFTLRKPLGCTGNSLE
jgi:hypothetical protein